jgi:hypothetical protein
MNQKVSLLHTFGDKGVPKNWGNPRKSTPGFFSLGKMVPVTEFENCKTDKPVKTDTSVSSFTINRSGSKSPFPKNHGFYSSQDPTRGESNDYSNEIPLMRKFSNFFSDSSTPIDPRTSNISVRINARSIVPLGTIISGRKNSYLQQTSTITPRGKSGYQKKNKIYSNYGMSIITEADEPVEDPYTILPPGCNAIDK